MADRTIPAPTSGRVTPAPGASPSPGGGDPWASWQELELDPADSSWTLVAGSGGAGATAAFVGGNMQIDFPGGQDIRTQFTELKGLTLIRSAEIKPWADAGLALPGGAADWRHQPESIACKIEVQFDPDEPIDGTSTGGYGQNLIVGVGIIHYAADQSGSPGLTGADWTTAAVIKNTGADPQAGTSTNDFRAGFRTMVAKADVSGFKWRCQPTASADGHDSIVFQAGLTVRRDTQTAQMACTGGSYASQSPFGPMACSGYSFANSSNKISDRHLHFVLTFGSKVTSTATRGTIKIKRIRVLFQPLSAREALVAV